MLDDARVRNGPVGVVHDGNALVVGCLKNFGFKTHTPVLKGTLAVVKVPVDGPCVDHGVHQGIERRFPFKVVRI